MSKTHETLYLEESTVLAVTEAAEEAGISKSEAYRQIIDVGVENAEIGDLIPEHARILQNREEVKERNRVRDLRGGFEGRVLDAMRKRWQNGYRVDDLRSLAVGYRDEARILWPDDEDRREDALDYVERVLDAIEGAESDSDVDRLDPEEVMSGYSGVERGRQRSEAEQELLDDAAALLTSQTGSKALPPEVVVDRLAKRKGVTREAAETAVAKARGEAGDSSSKDERDQ